MNKENTDYPIELKVDDMYYEIEEKLEKGIEFSDEEKKELIKNIDWMMKMHEEHGIFTRRELKLLKENDPRNTENKEEDVKEDIKDDNKEIITKHAIETLGNKTKVNYFILTEKYYIDGFHYDKRIWVKIINENTMEGGYNRPGASTELHKLMEAMGYSTSSRMNNGKTTFTK